jgi:transcriptional regulator with XRE-family HTH domain
MIGKDICKRIQEIRKSLKLTQSQFAELVNLSEDSVGKIERGVTIPTIDTLYKIATGLKMPIEELITPSKAKHPQEVSKAIADFINYLKTCSPEDVRFIHEIAIRILERKK